MGPHVSDARRGAQGTCPKGQYYPTPLAFGTGLLVLGCSLMAVAGLSHWSALRRLRAGQPLESEKWPLTMVLALLLTVLFATGPWAVFAR